MREGYDLYPDPPGSAGARLCRTILGLREWQYLRHYDRTNLCRGTWSASVARAAADAILTGPPRPLVLLGARVAAAFRTRFAPFSEQHQGWPGVPAVMLPHPSGRNRAWSEPGAFQRAREAVRAAGLLPPPTRCALAWCQVGGCVVAVRTAARPQWHLPGGKVRPGEDPRDAALRELREATLVGVAESEPAYAGPSHDGQPMEAYRVRVQQDLSGKWTSAEGEVGLLALAELDAEYHPDFREAFRRVRDEVAVRCANCGAITESGSAYDPDCPGCRPCR